MRNVCDVTRWLAELAYQNGIKARQRSWWQYVKDRATKAGIAEQELLKEIEQLKREGAKG